MKEIQAIIKRLTLLYYVFLVVIIAAVSINVYSVFKGDAIRSWGEYASADGVDLPGDAMSFNLIKLQSAKADTLDLGSGVRLTVIPRMVDMLVETTSGDVLSDGEVLVSLIGNLVVLVSSLIFAVVFLILVFTLGRSIVRQDIFNNRSVVLLKWFAVCMVVLFVAVDVNMWIDEQVVSRYLTMPGYVQNVGFTVSFSTIIVALLIYMFAEFLRIGQKLKQEQDLTI